MSEPTVVMKEFLRELEELTRKHDIMIQGCGCCGSPWLAEIDDDKRTPEYGYTVSNIEDCLEWSRK